MKWLYYSKDLIKPSKAHANDAGYDCYLLNDLSINSLECSVVSLGFGVHLKKDECAQIILRSSIAKQNLIANNCPIDCGYTGEIHLILHNLSRNTMKFKKGERICQLVIYKIPKSYGVSNRKNGAFGSSGK